jgi:prepilin-type N-terminal cleavage/methylation domain-containing protein
MTTSERRAGAGFTLLEMLVVLLIAGMALALTTQALGQYQRAYARASASEQAGREYRLSESWFRDSVRALSAAPDVALPGVDTHGSAPADQPPPVFVGRSDGFSGLTLAPVLAGQGVPVVQAGRVVRGPGGRDTLELREEGHRLLLSLPGNGRLQLHYLDDAGDLHAQWPPAMGTWPQLPGTVVLELVPGNDGMGTALVVAAVMGPRDPMTLPYEPEPL